MRSLRFRHPKIVGLAKKYSKDPAHILLRYSLQKVSPVYPCLADLINPAMVQGFIPLPKSSSKARIESNLQVFDFELGDQDVAELDALDECKPSRAYRGGSKVLTAPQIW